MTAKEMFEKLGFVETQRSSGILSFYCHNKMMYIDFDRYGRFYYTNIRVTKDVHQAIHQQMKELGWIE